MIHDDIIRSLRIVQLALVILAVLAAFRAGWLPLLFCVQVMMFLQLVILELRQEKEREQ